MNGAAGPVVKICGLRGTERAVAAARAGADLLGFNFAPVSKRRIAQEVAQEAIAACREGDAPAPTMVGVFVNQPLEEITAIVRACRLDAVQLSGSESVAFCRQVGMESGAAVYRAVRLQDGFSLDLLTQEAGAGGVSVLLVDAPQAGAWGGTGQSWDWALAAPLARRFPVLLAGGLHADNVAGALEAVRPWGVDLASGVETGGQTDPHKVAHFVQRVRQKVRS
ncbi:MAG TPA: phosphoribosylanthranilate isomerase [Chloroflexota bacterium]|nr:phosphoribosylanthranilate isomerase [Chloroflexota bacterium]